MNPIGKLRKDEQAERFPDDPVGISEADVVRFKLAVSKPVRLAYLPLLSKLDRAARRKRRGLGKRLIARPAAKLFRILSASGMEAQGRMRIETQNGPRSVVFNARNTQFSAVYLPNYRPFYEAELCGVFDRLVGPQDVFFDIGANWGWHSVVLATRKGFQGKVHAFEPFPSSYADLVSVVRQAGLESLIECHDIAVSDTDGTAKMHISDGMHSGGAQLDAGGKFSVRLAKLDSLDLPPPKAMKIDVEDHELNVLTGASKLIERARPFIVFENWAHKDKPDATFAPIDFLTRAGYALYYPGWVSGNPDCIVSNYAGLDEIALVPFLPAHRYQLGDLINIVAVPGERLKEFRRCFVQAGETA